MSRGSPDKGELSGEQTRVCMWLSPVAVHMRVFPTLLTGYTAAWNKGFKSKKNNPPHFLQSCVIVQRRPVWCSGEESACQCRRCNRRSLDPWAGKMTWCRKWRCTALFLSGKFHGQRSLAGHRPWGRRVGRERATEHTHMYIWMQFKYEEKTLGRHMRSNLLVL